MNRTSLPLLLCAAVTALSCGNNQDNPFADFAQLEVIPEDADLVFVSNLHTGPGTPREVFALRIADGAITRLTYCTEVGGPCDNLEAAPHPDRLRLALRRITEDVDRSGQLDEADGVALVVSQLDSGFESPFTPALVRVTGVDWLAAAEVIVYSGVAPDQGDDLFTVEATGLNTGNITNDPTAIERRVRVEPAGRVAVFERTPVLGSDGQPLEGPVRSEIWIFQSSISQFQVTSGGLGEGALPGTRVQIGSDTDPAFSPGNEQVVFRRLTANANGGRGSWDVLRANLLGDSELQVVASGPEYRGAPDWGQSGIVYVEWDVEAGTKELVLVQPDGSQRQTLLRVDPDVELANPRWVPPPPQQQFQ
jgi:hypothetical protein